MVPMRTLSFPLRPGALADVEVLFFLPSPAAARVSDTACSTHDRASAISCLVTVRGIMISMTGVPPLATRSRAASIRARTCMAYRPGLMTPSRTPRGAEHGVELVPLLGRLVEGLLLFGEPLSGLFYRQLGGVGEELVQRRVEEAHRYR